MKEFIIESTLCLAIFLLVYYLLMEYEKMHRFKRFYLLFSLTISAIIPLLSFEIIEVVTTVKSIVPSSFKATTFHNQENIIEPNVGNFSIILWTLYIAISVFLLARFGLNIWYFYKQSISNPIIKYKNVKFVLINKDILPHTFLNLIFVNQNDYNNQAIEKELFSHELLHVKQRHTLDILYIEFIKCIFWFNPILFFYKKAIQLNHEFLADEYIVTTFNNVKHYQELLLQKSGNKQSIFLASNLNYLITKKRLIMMTKETTKKIAVLKKVAIVPVIATLIYFLCIEVIAQEKNFDINLKRSISGQTNNDKVRDNYYSGVWVKIIDERISRNDVTLYENMSLHDKRKYLNYIPPIRKEIIMSESLFQKLKGNNMVVYIDGNLKTSEELKNYKITDFSYFTNSFVSTNAKSNSKYQRNQFVVFTKKYFEKYIKNSHLHFQRDTVKIKFTNYRTALNKIAD